MIEIAASASSGVTVVASYARELFTQTSDSSCRAVTTGEPSVSLAERALNRSRLIVLGIPAEFWFDVFSVTYVFT